MYGFIERYISVNLGKGSISFSFVDGVINSAGIKPATFATSSAYEQYLIENLEDFKNGKIKLINVTGEPMATSETKKEKTKVDSVTNLQEARNYLLAMGVEMKDISKKEGVIATAESMGIEFPNWNK